MYVILISNNTIFLFRVAQSVKLISSGALMHHIFLHTCHRQMQYHVTLTCDRLAAIGEVTFDRRLRDIPHQNATVVVGGSEIQRVWIRNVMVVILLRPF